MGRERWRWLLLATLALPGCAVARGPLAATHPSAASAPTGRLAGPPAILRILAADLMVAPATPAPAALDPHAHHHESTP